MNKIVTQYKDIIGRTVTVSRDTKTRKYTISTQLGVSLFSYSFPNRETCLRELRDKYKPLTKKQNYR